MHQFRLLLIPLLLLCVQPVCAAVIVFDNGVPSNDHLSFSDRDTIYRTADDFTLGSATSIVSVAWFGAYWIDNVAPAASSFEITFYSDDSDAPGSVIASQVIGDVAGTLTGNQVSEFPTVNGLAYESAIDPVALEAGTTYWVSITNNTPTTDSTWSWLASATQGSDISRQSSDSGSTWGDRPYEHAFTFSAVPEPTSLPTFAIGVLLVCRRHRRG